MTSADCYIRFVGELCALTPTLSGPTSRPWDGLDSLAVSIGEDWGKYSPHLETLPPVKSFQLRLPVMSKTFRSSLECERSPLGLPPQVINRLTYLFICIDWIANHLLSIIGQCESMEELTIHFWGHPLEYPPQNPISQPIINNGVLLPKVHKLRLERASIDSLPILPLLRAPNLRQLEIDFSRFGYSDTVPFPSLEQRHVDKHWLPFAQRHSRALRDIRISCSEGSFPINGSPHAMLRPFLSLTRLTLDGAAFDAKSLFADDTSASGGQFLMKLETLELLRIGSDFDMDQVFSFFEASVVCSSPLISIQLMHPCLKKLKVTLEN
ncbi:hypothetical protein FA13DRAFT_1784335 [Coprinellus micaceus]|uniref:F-box domain-containing protein n=1 Tax=Coprinellus micaceus TaxID=71717 RepID=A0A4Y7TZN6_COPMI|nr:hypothetical protein FA13DRAFT_1784335 [Coprinellus micaceus]